MNIADFDSIQFQNSINHLFFKGSKWQKRELQLQLVIFTQSGSIPRLWGLSFTLFYCLQTTVWLPQRFSNDYPGNWEVVFIKRIQLFFTMNETKLKDNVQKTNFIFGRFAPKAVSQQFHSTKGIKLTLDGTFQRLSCWDKRAQWALSTWKCFHPGLLNRG